MRCADVQARLLAGQLDQVERIHLGSCSSCRAAASGLEKLREQLADPLLWEEPSPELEQRIMAAIGSDVRRSRRRVVELVALLGVAAVLVSAVLWWRSRPDWTIHLQPTALAPQATAVVRGWNTEYGTRMVIDIQGLEPLEPDGYYEVWMSAHDGRRVSAGTFRAGGKVVVWGAYSRTDFPRIWVTYEPADGDPGPSGLTVLDTPGT